MKDIKLEFEPRPQQTEILEFVKKSIDSEHKFSIIDAPTGVGKSYAAVMIADWYVREINKEARITVLTNSKILQDQYIKDFDFMSSLKGNNNYFCKKNSMPCGESKILNKAKGTRCTLCPHTIAQSRFIKERVSLTNYHLITAYSIYSPEILADRHANLLIVDEAHSFEETFCDFISSTFSERSLTLLEIWEPWMESDLDGISTIKELANYVKKIIIPRLQHNISTYIEQAKFTRSRKKKTDFIKKADHCDKSMCKYNRFINDEDNYSKNWVFEKDLDYKGSPRILVEPIWGRQYLKETFWDKYDHVIFMSGTILDPKIFTFLMGIESDKWTYLDLPCPFKEENRPIIYVKFGKMSYYDKKDTFKRAIPIIKKILEKNENNKGIIHSGNYELNGWIKNSIHDPRLLIHDPSTREESLIEHLKTGDKTVLVSPSMMSGIDLKDDFSRFQIILKIPFPNLMSSKIKKRLETYPDWYNWKTLVEVMQAYGRSIRNDEDWAETYILDSCFDQVIRSSKAPQYFLRALKTKKLN